MRLLVATILSGLALGVAAAQPARAQGWLDNLYGYYDHRYGDGWDYRRDQRGYANRSWPPQHWHGSSAGSFQGPAVEHGQ